jgi:hypothetical protein
MRIIYINILLILNLSSISLFKWEIQLVLAFRCNSVGSASCHSAPGKKPFFAYGNTKWAGLEGHSLCSRTLRLVPYLLDAT